MPKDTLANIPAEKRERVLRESAVVFAERGFNQTDMAALAKRCGISKGSIYTYFDSKEELYLTVCRDALERSRAAVWGEVSWRWDIYRLIEHTFRCGLAFAQQHPEYVAAYLGLASPGLEQFAEQLSHEVERPTADKLKTALRQGLADGIVRPALDVPHAAWLINNSYVMFMTAQVSRHFAIRLHEYLEIDDDSELEDQLERSILQITSLLRPTVVDSDEG